VYSHTQIILLLYSLLLSTRLPIIPHWTGLQVVVPRSIPGAVAMQIHCTSMEYIDTVDKITPKSNTT
jgi:hypothetical protein